MVLYAGGWAIGERGVNVANEFYLKSNDSEVNSNFLEDLIGLMIFVG